MPIPYQDRSDGEPAATVAYLRVMAGQDGGELQAALFLTNEKGEPLEFCFTRVEMVSGTLWRPDLAHRAAVVLLLKALFEAAKHSPDLVLGLVEEIPVETLADDMEVQVPVCLVAGSEVDSITLQWVNGEPEAGTPLSALVELLKARNLLLEPFQRAAQGLEEAYASQ